MKYVFCEELKGILIENKVYHWSKKFKKVVGLYCLECREAIKIFEMYCSKEISPYHINFFNVGFYLCHRCSMAVDLWHKYCPNCSERRICDNTCCFESLVDVFNLLLKKGEFDCNCGHNTFLKLGYSFCPICSCKLNINTNLVIDEKKINWLLFGLGKIMIYFYNSWVRHGKVGAAIFDNHYHDKNIIMLPFHCFECQKLLKDKFFIASLENGF